MRKKIGKISLTNQIMLATVAAILFGSLFQGSVSQLRIIGELFLRLIQMSVVLLIMGSVIEAVGGLEAKELGKIGGKIFLWFAGSTILAAIFGIFFGYLMQPGVGLNQTDSGTQASNLTQTNLEQMLLDFIPVNIIEAMAQANMIQVIVFSLLFGFSLSILKKDKHTRQFLTIVTSFNRILIQMITLIMKLAPIGIFGLVAALVGESGLDVLGTLLNFLVTLIFATLLFLLLWFIVTALYCKVSLWRLIKNMRRLSIISFTTASSAVSLPFQIEDGLEKFGISDRINKLVMPLGMTLNSNGLSLFLSLSIVTFAQYYGIDLGIENLIQIVLLSSLACLGTIVVPGGGLVTLATVMPLLGLPAESIALLAGIDWFSGMFRTLLNVDGDVTVAMIIAKDENELDVAIFNGTKRIDKK